MVIQKAAPTADPKTGVPLPDAVLHMVDAEFHLAADIGIVWVATFGSAALQSAGYGMVGEAQKVVLTSAENKQVRTALLGIISARPEYAGLVVT